MSTALIASDQGTTSTRAIAFDGALRPLATAQQELCQIYPAPGFTTQGIYETFHNTLGNNPCPAPGGKS